MQGWSFGELGFCVNNALARITGTKRANTLTKLARIMPERRCVVARELTKLDEGFVQGTIDELAKTLNERELLDEVTIVIGPHENVETPNQR